MFAFVRSSLRYFYEVGHSSRYLAVPSSRFCAKNDLDKGHHRLFKYGTVQQEFCYRAPISYKLNI